MKYAEKYGFTAEQVAAIKEHESKLGLYDGRFEKDAPENVPEQPKPEPQEVKRGPGRPSTKGVK